MICATVMKLQVVLAREALQLRAPRHRAVGVEDLADHAGGREPGHAREVHRRLRLTDAAKHAAGPGAQREDVARAPQVGGLRLRVQADLDGPGAVRRR
jgi:hypothetical protein